MDFLKVVLKKKTIVVLGTHRPQYSVNASQQNIQFIHYNSDHNLFIPQCMMGAINEL